MSGCAAGSQSVTVTLNLIGPPRMSSPGLNGSVGSVGSGYSGYTLPAPLEKSRV